MKQLLMLLILMVFCVPTEAISRENDFRFKRVYHKAFYQKPLVMGGIMVAVTAAAAAATTLTAGTGAPAAAAGVGSVATWIGGGGSGAYMAGLSTVGSFVGGNAIVGGAILNSASVALTFGLGGTSILSKATMLTLGALELGQTGIIILTEEDQPGSSQRIEYSINIPLVKKLGDEKAERLIEDVNRFNEDIASGAYSMQLMEENRQYLAGKSITLADSSSLENKIVALTVLYNLGFINEYKEHSLKLNDVEDKYNTFIYYLKSIAYLLDKDWPRTSRYARLAMINEPKVIEPVMIYYISEFAQGWKSFNTDKIIENINEFSNSYYSTPNNKKVAYMLIGDLFYSKNKYSKSSIFYKLAYRETNLFGDSYVKSSIAIKYANSLYYVGEYENAKKYYGKALAKSDEDRLDLVKSSCVWTTICE